MSSKTIKPELYNDLHPKTSLKKTGYANPTIAKHTIRLISKRSLKYQFDVVNTMYNRAKYHPNQTQQMKNAMDIFYGWLSKYKKKSVREKNKYPWLSLQTVMYYKKFLHMYSTGTSTGTITGNHDINKDVIKFFNIYQMVKGKSYKLQYMPIDPNDPSYYDYYSYRIKFVKDTLKRGVQLFYKKGKMKGLPTKEHFELIMCAYSPCIDLITIE